MSTSGLLSVLLVLAQAGLDADLRATDPAVRLAAVRRIERLGTEGQPDAARLAALAPLLRERDLTLRGLAALAIYRHIAACKESVPDGVTAALLGCLHDENRHVAAFCRRSLSSLGPLALPDVRDWLRPERGPQRLVSQRLAALEACRLLAASERCRDRVVSLLWLALSDPEPTVAERARIELTHVRDKYPPTLPEDSDSVGAALGSANERIRALAATELVAAGDRAFGSLVLLLRSSNPIARHEAGRVLEVFLRQGVYPKVATAFELLRELRRSDTPEWGALRQRVQRIADAQFAPVAEALLRVDPWLRLMRDPNQASLEEQLEARNPETQQFAAEALGKLGDAWQPSPRALEAFADLLESPSEQTARAAAFTLSQCLRPTLKIPPRLLTTLGDAFRKPDRRNRSLCTVALAACGPQAEPELIRLLRDPDPNVRFYPAMVVYRMASEHHLYAIGTADDLERLAQSRDTAAAFAARTALNYLIERPEKKP